jgi:hypothetical protein
VWFVIHDESEHICDILEGLRTTMKNAVDF